MDKLSSINIGCKLGLYSVNVLGYADDFVLVAPSLSGLNLLIDNIKDSLNEHNLSISLNKTACMNFRHNNVKNRNKCRIYLNQTVLKTVTEHKYLGIIFDSINCNKSYINRALLSFYKQYKYKYKFIS